MKAFVTGGAGFLGRHIVKELINREIETVSFDVIDLSDPAVKSVEYFQHIVGSIMDSDALEEAMEGCDIVFHTAALANLDESPLKPVETIETNVIGTIKCLETAKKIGINRFMFSSTVYVSGKYGSFYRISKQTGESLCKQYFREYGLEYTILRYGSLYGSESNNWNFISSVCRELLLNGEYTYRSSPDSMREYIHIGDAARETVRISLDNEFINKIAMISGHQRMKVKELFTMIEEILGRKITVNYTPEEKRNHYIMTPYSFDEDVPVRVNLPVYIDISEGVLDCIRRIQSEMNTSNEN